MANEPTPDYLAGLTQLSHRSICGGLDKQEIFYRADEVAALVAQLVSAQPRERFLDNLDHYLAGRDAQAALHAPAQLAAPAPLADAELADAELAELVALHKEAYGSTWHRDGKWITGGSVDAPDLIAECYTNSVHSRKRAKLITTAINALPSLLARLTGAEAKLAAIRAMATRSVPQCLNLEAIDRVLAAPTVKGAQSNG